MIKGLNWLSTLMELKVNSERRAGACVACLTPNAFNGLCAPCRLDLPVNHWACRVCALPLPIAGHDRVCGGCLTDPPPFDRALIPWRYQFPVDSMIHRYKYLGQHRFARPLIQDLGHRLTDVLAADDQAGPQALIPAPMHRHRRRERGFNQAQDIAEHLGQHLCLPVHGGLVHRGRQVRAQRDLKREQRLENLKGVFEVHGRVPERIAIVDDVVTTGATVRALASLLRQAGARHIEVWALARTPG